MQLMILVDDAGGVLPAINHSPWNGVTLADFVMPFFLFIVGVSLGLTYKVSFHLRLLYDVLCYYLGSVTLVLVYFINICALLLK